MLNTSASPEAGTSFPGGGTKTESYSVAQVGFELGILLCRLSVGVKGTQHHTRLLSRELLGSGSYLTFKLFRKLGMTLIASIV